MNPIFPDKIRVEVCPSEDQSSRQYDTMRVKQSKLFGRFDDGVKYGNGEQCSDDRIEVFQDKTITGSPVTGYSSEKEYHIEAKACFNFDRNADRFFDLRSVVADTAANKVVTGVRFLKKNKIIRMQIREGELTADGRIKKWTNSWMKLDDFRAQNGRLGVDYHQLEVNERTIELNDLDTTRNQVVTGVKFISVGGRLKLSIQATQIDFENGRVLSSNSNWMHNSVKSTKEYAFHEPDIPLKLSRSAVDSQPDQFVTFTHSDLKQDAAQSTVPFFDAQEVAPSPAVPLQGVGLFLKGLRGSGGFLTLRVRTFDYIGLMKSRTRDNIVGK